MGLQVLFRRHKSGTRDAVSTVVGAGDPEPQEPLTPQQMAELQDAWDELAEAAEGSEVTGVHACSRNGSRWEEDPAAVRRLAATLRAIQAENTTAGN